jgi:hypothetical protein
MKKKNPSSSQQRLGCAPNSNLILFPWPQGISLLQNGPFCEAKGPMPDFTGFHKGEFNRSGKCKEGGGDRRGRPSSVPVLPLSIRLDDYYI